jgi:DNA-binding Lrp family transcriptional regulator
LRVLLWAEAGWKPTPRGKPAKGEVVPSQGNVMLAQAHIATALRIRRSTVSKAIKRLIEAGLITLTKPSIRPGSMGGGGGHGQAAVYDLPHRHKGAAVRFEAGDKRLPGFVKAWCDELRGLIAELSDPAARILIFAAAVARSRDGTPLQPEIGIDLSGARLTRELPGVGERAAQRAVRKLLARGQIEPILEGAGCRSAHYRITGVLATQIRRRGRKRD